MQTSGMTVSLLQAGLFIAVALGARMLIARRVPLATVPHVLHRRVAVMNRLCPWLLVAAVTMIAVGLAVPFVNP